MRFRHRERGGVLMITVIFFTLAFLLVGSWLASSLVHERTLTIQKEHVQSVYLLDSGVTWAVYMLENDPQWSGGRFDTPAGRIKVDVTREVEGRRELYVSGRAADATAAAKVWLEEDGRLIYWHEIGNVQE